MCKTDMFKGLAGRAVAKVMARSNRDTELEAIEILDPSPGDVVVAIGIGPGVGVRALSTRVRTVVGIDPSQVMIDEASRRCRDGIDAGFVQLHRTDAAAIPVSDSGADGAVAVNSIQLWDPLDASLAEIARVLRPDGRLVTLTHDWAIQRSCRTGVEAWVERTTELCAQHGLVAAESRRAVAEAGRSVIFTVRKDRS
jgi:ubiquinone/menaquinone biosynthesis C-methylase UbiE